MMKRVTIELGGNVIVLRSVKSAKNLKDILDKYIERGTMDTWFELYAYTHDAPSIEEMKQARKALSAFIKGNNKKLTRTKVFNL